MNANMSIINPLIRDKIIVTIQIIRHRSASTPHHQGCVATIGNFDGVHRGHQALLAQLIQRSHEMNLPSLVLTFEPQPAEYFAWGAPIARLTRFREKVHYLAQTGLDKVWVLRFDASLAALAADEFVKKILVDQLNIKHLVIGDDFRFGHRRQGNLALLKSEGERWGFSVENMPTVWMDGDRVSSTRVRQALSEADPALAERLLGRPYCMLGRVVYGNQLGRLLGFPTANIYLHRQETAVKGIYAVRLHGIAKTGLPGVANVGTRPTVGGTRILLEVHLFDFAETIYGRQVEVEFCKKLRDEERFDNLDLLKDQMVIDAAEARAYLNNF